MTEEDIKISVKLDQTTKYTSILMTEALLL